MVSGMMCRDHRGKVAFSTEGQAAGALRAIRRKSKRGQHIPVRHVRCGQCHDVFLTSSGKDGRWV